MTQIKYYVRLQRKAYVSEKDFGKIGTHDENIAIEVNEETYERLKRELPK